MTIYQFFYPILRPHLLRICLMMQAPFIDAIYYFANNYAVKMLVDSFTTINDIGWQMLLLPLAIYCGSVIIMEASWRLSQYNWFKTQPEIRAEIIVNSYKYIQNYNHYFFQNNLSGSIVSKIRGVVDGYNNIWGQIHHRLTKSCLCCLVCLLGFAVVSRQFFYLVAIWTIVFLTALYITSRRLHKVSKNTSDAKHRVIALITDNIINIFTIFNFASSSRELKKLQNQLFNDAVLWDKKQIKHEMLQAIIGCILYFIVLFSLLFLAVEMRINNEITTGEFVFIMSFSWFFIEQIWGLFLNISEFSRNFGDFKSAFAILQNPQNPIDKADAKELLI